jgi:hypothetical protein
VEADSDSASGGCRDYDQGKRLIKDGHPDSERGNEEAVTGTGGRGTTNPTGSGGDRTIEDGTVGDR